MTTYTAIPNGDIDQDSPGTQPLFTLLRDNPIAITEGAPGAPRIIGEAMATADELTPFTVAASDAESILLGSVNTTGTLSTSSTSYVEAYSFTVGAYTGSARYKLSHSATGGATSDLRVKKNGGVVTTWSTTSSASRSSDISVVPGDVISWEHKIGLGTETSSVSGVDVTADDGITDVPVLGRTSLI